VSLALLPIGVLLVLLGIERASVDVTHVRQTLVQTVRIAASNEENVLASSEQILRTLAKIDDVRAPRASCDQTLAAVLAGMHFLTNLARIDAQGRVICSAVPAAKGMMVDPALLRDVRQRMSFTVSGELMSPLTHGRIIGAILPLAGPLGRFDGAVAVGIGANWLDHILRARDPPKGAVIAVFDRSGKIVASNDDRVSRSLFAQLPEPQALRGGLDARQDGSGRRWIVTAAPLLGSNVFVALAMRQNQLFVPTYLTMATDFLLPIVMLGLAWIAIWFAAESQITQWIVYLRRIAAAYRGGHYGARPALQSAPEEFQSLGSAMAEMAAGIQDRDQRLRDVIAQKTLLLRETHHRVKNNLQIVMSLLSLQSSQIREPAAKAALSQAQARIDALALVHRLLHEVEDQTTVDLKRLLGELARKIFEGASLDGAAIHTNVDCVNIQVPSEIAVPIALFTVEALMNISKFAFPESHGDGSVRVALQRHDRQLALAIEDDGIGYLTAAATPGIGSRLLDVFARQVRGKLCVTSKPDQGTIVELVFADPSPMQ